MPPVHRRGPDRWRPRPAQRWYGPPWQSPAGPAAGRSPPIAGNLFRLFDLGGWCAASDRGGGRIGAGGDGDFALGTIAVSGWASLAVEVDGSNREV